MKKENKFAIELNGVANIKMLLQFPLKNEEMQKQALDEQLELLERYMLAVADAARNEEEPPFWHEIRENKNKYPLNKERR